MDAAWSGLTTGFEHSDGLMQLGEIRTMPIRLAGYGDRLFVPQQNVIRAYSHPSAATWKRRIQDGLLESVQPGGPNTLVYVEVAAISPGICEPVYAG